MSCPYGCTNEDYGGTFAFRGLGVVEQTVAIDLCEDHWGKFYSHLLKGGWIPNTNDDVRLVRLYEENGYSADTPYHETEIETGLDTGNEG